MARSGPRTPPQKPPQQARRPLGLDKPCNQCGEAIYYNYKGPIDGLCGRCADEKLGRHRKGGKTRVVVRESRSKGRSAALYLALGFLVGAAAMYLAHPFLP